MDWRFNDDKTRVVLNKIPKRPKRITGTRLASILGLDPWKTAFKTWCEISNVYKDDFVGNKYTNAGKKIEPILIEWAKEQFDGGVFSPEEFYGAEWKTIIKKRDFFPDEKVFGGMWDATIVSGTKRYADIEFKTSSRPQDWVDGPPVEKKVQSLLYSHLDKAKKTFLVVAFLNEEDYWHPENFVPKLGENVKLYSFETESETIKFDGEDCTISQLVAYAQQWWDSYVRTGTSPEFDNKIDEKIIKALRTQRPDEDVDSDLKTILTKIDEIEYSINTKRIDAGLDVLEGELKNFKDALKRTLTGGMGENDEKVEVGRWTLNKSERTSVDTDALKKDGLYDKYTKTSVTYTLKSKGEIK